MRIEELGYLYFERRLDGMINNAYHFYPDEVEVVLRGVKGVDEVAVRGETQSTGGDLLVAYVVIAQGHDSSQVLDSAKLHASQRLARYKIPKRWVVVDSLG